MSKRKMESLENANKKEKTIPFSTTDYLKNLIVVGDRSAWVFSVSFKKYNYYYIIDNT